MSREPDIHSFTGTPWELITETDWNDPSELTRQKLEILCEKYWKPIFAYIYAKVKNLNDASDLTQEFFFQFLKKDILVRADASRGRFRDFLRVSARNLVANHYNSQKRLKRGGHLAKLSFEELGEEAVYLDQLSTKLDPEKIYEQRWASSILDMAIKQVRLEYQRKGMERQFELLEPLVFLEENKATHQQVADELNKSVNWVSVNVVRMRAKAVKALKSCVADTLQDDQEVDDEFAHLMMSLNQ